MGIAVAVFILLRNSFKNSHFLHLESHNGNKHVKMILAEEVYFLNKGAILNELNKIKPGSSVTIDTSRSVSIDYDVQEVIRDFKEQAKSKDIQVSVLDRKRSEENRKKNEMTPEHKELMPAESL
jgi:MFS superfamily sulfate permease-like transporter